MKVFLDRNYIGYLEVIANAATFTYDNDWRLGNSTPLSLSMPLSKSVHKGAVVKSFFDGLLPDNEDTRKRWGREFGVSAGNVFALASSVGRDLPGAVGLVTEDDSLTADQVLLDESDIANQLKVLREDNSAWHFNGAGGQFSLAGAQGKLALAFVDGQWSRPGGDDVTTHIIKPGVSGITDSDLNEYLCLQAAALSGLTVARTKMMNFGNESAVVVDRFDRWDSGGSIQRIHQEDFCQALGVPTANKYQSDGGPSAADIAALLRSHVQPHAVEEDLWRFVDALLFNWMIAGTDAHAKNYALLLRQSQVRLAPLYDIASILPYKGVHSTKRSLAMSIGGEYKVSLIRRRHWVQLAEQVGVDAVHLLDRANELAEFIPTAFKDAVKELRDDQVAFGSELAKSAEAHVAECRRALDSSA